LKSREQLEAEINMTPYFSITGDNTEALKKSELYKLSAMIFEYCKRFMYSRNDKAAQYGAEIYSCTINCLKNFKPEQSPSFLNYLKVALSRNIKNAEYRENKTKQKFNGNFVRTDENEYYSIIDNSPSRLGSPEEELTEKEMILDELGIVDDVFISKQDRVKPYLKKLISREYYDKIVRFFKVYSFIDLEMVKNTVLNKGALPSQKEIAESFGRHEADASRTLHKFIDEVRKKQKKC
jgi:hypothetical protein